MEHSSDRPQQYHFDPDSYLAMVTTEVPAYLDLQEQVGRATEGVTAELILDLGAGTGETSAGVLGNHPAARLVGIDESPAMLARARERLPHADFRVQRLEEPLPAGPYDLVVSALAIHHLDGEGKADLFRRIAERLRPGGRFVMGDVVIPDDPADIVTPIDGRHDRPSGAVEQLQWLRDAGLRPAIVWAHRDLAVIAADRP
ncbi:MAG TPA: class I SAM-dependent methyltransferase [Acidimicrobiales bacterium]|nr:class I SAM-dependent methyltransferase [Acidimicrobiales bacterium]